MLVIMAEEVMVGEVLVLQVMVMGTGEVVIRMMVAVGKVILYTVVREWRQWW